MCVFVIEVSFMLLWIFCIASLIWGAVIHHLSQNFQHLCFLSVCKPHFMCEEWNSADNGVVTLTCIFLPKTVIDSPFCYTVPFTPLRLTARIVMRSSKYVCQKFNVLKPNNFTYLSLADNVLSLNRVIVTVRCLPHSGKTIICKPIYPYRYYYTITLWYHCYFKHNILYVLNKYTALCLWTNNNALKYSDPLSCIWA